MKSVMAVIASSGDRAGESRDSNRSEIRSANRPNAAPSRSPRSAK